MRKKHSIITLILIQLFVISAIIGAVSPSVSAAQNDTNTTTSLLARSPRKSGFDVGFDWFDAADNRGPEFVLGEVLVKFKTDVSLGLTSGIVATSIASVDKLNTRFEAKGIERVFSDVYKLALPKDADVLSVAKEYEADPNVEYAQPNYIYHYSAVPNDTEYWKQWAHEVTQAELAWNTTTGDPSVVIAILDSGVQWNHTDLAANIWNNTDEIPDNGIDDDENGYVDDIRGWDFYDNDSDPMDTYGHGTHCAGIAAAVGNNGKGVAGVSWLSSIMAVRVGDDYGPTTDGIIKGIRYATDNGANIISMSFGDYTDDPTTHNEVTIAYNSNVLLVAAAGNSATYYPHYPAAWSEVVAVSATDSADDPAFFTNFGDWIEVAAPGVHIYSTLPNNTYGYASGTSMSCPYVAGVAALIKGRFPNMTNVEVRGQLGNTTDDIGEPSFDVYYGYGRVNARWAVDHASPEHDLRAWGMETPKVLKPGTTATINFTVLNFGKNEENRVDVKLLVNGSLVEKKRISNIQPYGLTTVNFSWTPQTEGLSNVTVYVVPPKRPREDYTNNNALSTRVVVRVEEVVRVPEDFSTIHIAVSAANPGYTVEVSNGTYYEYVDIDKPLTLTATDPDTTIIDGGGSGDPIIHVRAPAYIANVSVSQFIIRNGGAGIFTDASSPRSDFSFSSNVISGNEYGILLTATFGASVESNFLTNNTYGIRMYRSYGGNTIKDNVISNNTIAGIYAYDGGVDIIGNNIFMNGDGIYLNDSFFFIYHNNFIDNTRQLVIYTSSWPELDDGYPSGGNYWSDYNGTDLYSGPYQNETGSDGIGDTPYVINQDTQDNYPLIRPWGSIRNIDTDLIYITIQKAINATETIDGHTIEVKTATYYEEVVVNKSLTIIGEDPSTTILYSGSWGDSGFLVYSNDTTITGFTIRSYTKCVDLWSVNCNVSGNAFENFEYGIYLEADSSNNIISNNDMSTWGGSYGIYLDYSDKNTISDNTVTGKFIGVYMRYSDQNTITDNTFSYCTIGPISWHSGMYLLSCNDNIISGNTITNNEDYGIVLNNANDNTVSNNTISDNEYVGVLDGDDNNTISDNTISNNWCTGIYLSGSYNIIGGNTISNNGGKGVYVDVGEGILVFGSYNTISDNTISNNIHGIWLQANNNTIYHNNFIDNTNQTYVFPGKTSVWDDGYPSGGNYWSDYNGTDADEDGIGDTPYVIDANNQDNYPLMNPWEGPQAPTMHVESIDFKKKGPKLDVMVTIYDDASNPVPGAIVYMNITYPDESVHSVSEVTNDDGIAKYTITPLEQGTYIVTVTNVEKDGWIYDPDANVETTDSYTV